MRNTSNIPNAMKYNDISLSDPKEIGNAFAQFFQSSFIKSTPLCNSNGVCTVINVPNIGVPTITENDVFLALKRFKNKLTTGPDGIPAFLLKDCARVFALPLSIIFNISLRSATFPHSWKKSKITAIFKKGDRSNIESYRPIVILNNFSKLFEIVLYDVLSFHIKYQISYNQHGFLTGRSTTTNLVSITQFLAETIDDGSQTDVVYTDLSKAFDKLDHGLLLNKLCLFGITPKFLNFFQSYLSNRVLNVQYRGFSSFDIFICNVWCLSRISSSASFIYCIYQ